LLPGALAEVKQRFCGIEFNDFVGKMAFGGKVAEIENPDDAAVENGGTGVAETWLCVCHAQLGTPFEGSMPILSALSCKIFQQSFKDRHIDILLYKKRHANARIKSY